MVIKIFTNDDGPESRKALELGERLAVDYDVEYYHSEDEATEHLMELYDVYSFPTFIVTQNNGAQVEIWRGMVPLEGDVKIFLGF